MATIAYSPTKILVKFLLNYLLLFAGIVLTGLWLRFAFEGQIQAYQSPENTKILITEIYYDTPGSDIERECAGISRDMVRRVLRQLRDEGIIVSTGKGRSAKWQKKEYKNA